jgi:phospholipase/carboxylesterase
MIQPDHLISSGAQTHKLIFLLHGYGASGSDLIELAHFWSPSLPDTTFIAPNAPHRCDINYHGYQWFGLKDFDPLNMRAGIEGAAPAIAMFIAEQVKNYNLTLNQVAIVGFSQGAMLALELMYLLPGIAGILAYSGAFYRPLHLVYEGPFPPVMLVHGTVDQVVPFGSMSLAEKALTKQGVDVTTVTCHGLAHSIDVQGLQRGLDFLQETFTKYSSILYMNNIEAQKL